MKCRGTDTHHLFFPASDYRTKVESIWRDRDFNKVQLERCAHQAIHASGYIPDKPDRATMANDVWNDTETARAMTEREYQLQIGRKVLEGFIEGDPA